MAIKPTRQKPTAVEARKPVKTAPAGTPANAALPMSTAMLRPLKNQIIVRMYRQGLGDCFFLAFGTPNPENPFTVLIDAGVHARETDGKARMEQVLQDLQYACNSHLDVVVATHEHADHLCGFVQKNSPFLNGGIEIETLWVAWTEKVGDKQADELRMKRGTARNLIEKAAQLLRDQAGFGGGELGDRILGLTDFEDMPSNAVDIDDLRKHLENLKGTSKSTEFQSYSTQNIATISQDLGAAALRPRARASVNELAVELLKGKARHVEYCEPGQVLKLGSASGARAFVLGPPRELSLLKKDAPTKIRGAGDSHDMYKEVYLSAGGNPALALSPTFGEMRTSDGVLLHKDRQHPFQEIYRRPLKAEEAGSTANEVGKTTKFFDDHYFLPDRAWRRIDADWLKTTEQLALNLDSDTNNTSLALVFEIGTPGRGRTLLFPGDAQVGNWISWRDQTYKVDGVSASADDLLARTLLYKVGHHGSHNATVRSDPREDQTGTGRGVPFGLELMNDIIAMIPVDHSAVEKKMPDPWRMPHEPLYRRLRDKARRRVLRSDSKITPLEATQEQDITPGGEAWEQVPNLKGVQWRKSGEAFKQGTSGPLYYEILIDTDEL